MLKGKKVILRPVDVDSDLARCHAWINNREVNQFLVHPFKPITKEQERERLQKMVDDENSVVFAIDAIDGTHVGTTALVRISRVNGTAMTDTVIGNKQFWGQGYGTDAKMLLLWYAFCVLNLRRINSNVLAFNKRSIKCQLRCGYKIEGVKRKEIYKNSRYHDLIMLAVFKDKWLKLWQKYQKGGG